VDESECVYVGECAGGANGMILI